MARRHGEVNPAYRVPFMLFMFGITTAPVCSILLLVFSVLTWPPWGDSSIDEDLRKARGTVLSISSVERAKGRVSSWHLTTRIDSGPHNGKTARVFCSRDLSKVCPRVGESFDFEYCGHDLDLARMPGKRMTVMPPAGAIVLSVFATLGWLLLGVAGLTFLRVRARQPPR